jgi:hypothetical protein
VLLFGGCVGECLCFHSCERLWLTACPVFVAVLLKITDDRSYLPESGIPTKPVAIDNSLSFKMIMKVFAKIKLEAFEVGMVWFVCLFSRGAFVLCRCVSIRV